MPVTPLAEMIQGSTLLLPVFQIAWGNNPGGWFLRIQFSKDDDPIRLWQRQCAQQSRVHKTEDRCVCTDAQCKSQDGNTGKDRRLN